METHYTSTSPSPSHRTRLFVSTPFLANMPTSTEVEKKKQMVRTRVGGNPDGTEWNWPAAPAASFDHIAYMTMTIRSYGGRGFVIRSLPSARPGLTIHVLARHHVLCMGRGVMLLRVSTKQQCDTHRIFQHSKTTPVRIHPVEFAKTHRQPTLLFLGRRPFARQPSLSIFRNTDRRSGIRCRSAPLTCARLLVVREQPVRRHRYPR
ncbi:hypothetical protein LX36DRAFT_259077 [Colletotrichum falcatum]|nr:hypothetical protein LX36DRAFT_259077 [Colletotrichum falcatum]